MFVDQPQHRRIETQAKIRYGNRTIGVITVTERDIARRYFTICNRYGTCHDVPLKPSVIKQRVEDVQVDLINEDTLTSVVPLSELVLFADLVPEEWWRGLPSFIKF